MTSASRHLGHILALGVNAAVFLFSFCFVLHQSKRRANQPSHWLRYGPTYLTGIAALLILADQTRHVLQDFKIWHGGPWPGSSQYISDCPVRKLEFPERTCKANSDCGSFDCGGGYFSQNEGEDCFTCFGDTGKCSEEAETFACLTPVGWVFTVVMTYSGFCIFFFAMFWNANLLGKLAQIKRKWNAMRGGA